MIDQYLRDMEKDLGSVKAETVAVMAQESAAKRKVSEWKNIRLTKILVDA